MASLKFLQSAKVKIKGKSKFLRYDPDALQYFNVTGMNDDFSKKQVSDFVKGIKGLGLWNNMVCWPLRSSQNAGTGSTAYSLGGLGTFNGTLVNGPTWGVDGITFTHASAQYISTNCSYDASQLATGFATIVRPTDTYPTANNREICGNRGSSGSATVLTKNTAGGQQISLFDSVAGHNTASQNSTISTTFTNTWHFAGGILDSVTRLFFNQANSITNSATSSGGSIVTGSNNFQIGRAGTYGIMDRVWNGQISVSILFRKNSITPSNLESVRLLLRSTIGQGLGLP